MHAVEYRLAASPQVLSPHPPFRHPPSSIWRVTHQQNKTYLLYISESSPSLHDAATSKSGVFLQKNKTARIRVLMAHLSTNLHYCCSAAFADVRLSWYHGYSSSNFLRPNKMPENPAARLLIGQLVIGQIFSHHRPGSITKIVIHDLPVCLLQLSSSLSHVSPFHTSHTPTPTTRNSQFFLPLDNPPHYCCVPHNPQISSVPSQVGVVTRFY